VVFLFNWRGKKRKLHIFDIIKIMKELMAKIKLSEIFFLASGLGILFSLPWLEGGGFSVWAVAKAAYFAGVILLIFKK